MESVFATLASQGQTVLSEAVPTTAITKGGASEGNVCAGVDSLDQTAANVKRAKLDLTVILVSQTNYKMSLLDKSVRKGECAEVACNVKITTSSFICYGFILL